MKLTDASIKRIDTGGKADHIEWDDQLKGFGLRIRQGKTVLMSKKHVNATCLTPCSLKGSNGFSGDL